MIDEICHLLEDQLGWIPVEIADDDPPDGDELVYFRVAYEGMDSAEEWTPQVRELYRVELWVNEMTTARLTQSAIQNAARSAFTSVSDLLNANLFSSVVNDDVSPESEQPAIELIFRTVDPRREWE